jgi:predicted lysophospholipase L1 biosynthesis ABC-type transport system permease subunit
VRHCIVVNIIHNVGAATGVIALVMGTLAGWVIAFAILDVPYTFDISAVLVTVAGRPRGKLAVWLGRGAVRALSVRRTRSA